MSNQEVVEENEEDLGAWHKLKDKCLKDRLFIVKIFNNNEELTDYRAKSFFVIYDLLATSKGFRSIKKGIGKIYTSPEYRCRIYWMGLENAQNYVEVIKGHTPVYDSISIPIKVRSNDEMSQT